MKIRLQFIIYIFLFSIRLANAQYVEESQIEHYDSEDGLSMSYISSLYQDKNGFIWIGTQDGLNRFDGYSFRQFRHNIEDTSSINNNYIKWVFDYDNRLWVSTEN